MTMPAPAVAPSHFTVASARHCLRSFARAKCATMKYARMRAQRTNTDGIWTPLWNRKK